MVHVCAVLSVSGQTRPKPVKDVAAGSCRIRSQADRGTVFTVYIEYSGGQEGRGLSRRADKEPRS